MVKMKRILYISNVPWKWTKQRPQFLAEELSKKYQVTYVQESAIKNEDGNITKVTLKHLWHIPLARFRVIRTLNNYLYRIQLNKLCREADIIWFTSPQVYEWIAPKFFGQKKTVYDCMDDMLAFNKQSHYLERVGQQEKAMVQRADIVLATSNRLKGILCTRYPESVDKFYLVRNGYDGKVAKISSHKKEKLYTFCYFGTISHWFNFDYILKSLEEFHDVQYLLIGPVEGGTSVPEHERIVYLSPVKHDDLQKATDNADAFIMPFKVNELILSVDPVKLYEYINFGKDILCIRYPEIERFNEFVYFYDDYESFKNKIIQMKITKTRKYGDDVRLEFLKDNSWCQRAEEIVSILSQIG